MFGLYLIKMLIEGTMVKMAVIQGSACLEALLHFHYPVYKEVNLEQVLGIKSL